MGKPKTDQVGGGQATGVANDWNQFLQAGLHGGFAGPSGASTGVSQAAGQTNAFGGAINSMLGGMPGDPNTYAQYFNQLQNSGNGASPNGFANTQFRDLIPQRSFFDAIHQTGAGGAGGGFGFDVNSPEIAALRHVQQNQQANDVANLRARFGSGGTSLGSGASLAEGQYLSEANPRNILALGELGRQNAQLNLQALGMDSDNLFRALQGMNQNDFSNNQALNAFNQSNQQMQNQFGLGKAQVGLGVMGQQANTQSDILSKLFGAYGQSNQIGTPQAQTVQRPSGFGQVLGAIGGGLGALGNIAGAASPFGGTANILSRIFGSHGGSSIPNFGPMPGIQQTPMGGYPSIAMPSPVTRIPTGGYNPFSAY